MAQGIHLELQRIPCAEFKQEKCLSDYGSILQECGVLKQCHHGKFTHAHYLKNVLNQENFVDNQLIGMYGKCGNLEDAHRVFERMSNRSVVSWNALITAFASNGGTNATELFQLMYQEGITCNKVTFVSLLKACSPGLQIMAHGKFIHTLMYSRGFEHDAIVGTALINMYGKGGNLWSAHEIFCKLQKRDIFSWNTMIAIYAEYSHYRYTMFLFRSLLEQDLHADKITFINLLNGFCNHQALAMGKLIHANTMDLFKLDVVVGNAVVNMYAKCGSLEKSRRMFDGMNEKNATSWNTIINAYSHYGNGYEAIQLFHKMKSGLLPDKVTYIAVIGACSISSLLEDGQSIHHSIRKDGLEKDIVIATTLLNMYGSCNNMEAAWEIFMNIERKDIFSWSAMISACIKNGYIKVAMELLYQMQLEEMQANEITFISLLGACANFGMLTQGRRFHACVLTYAFKSKNLVSAVIRMYGDCGSLEDACQCFNQSYERSLVLTNTMIAVYVSHGCQNGAIQLYDKMHEQGVLPDTATFTMILNICCCPPILSTGKAIHAYIICECKRDTAIGNAIITFYGKCESLEDAHLEFDSIHVHDIISWNALIAAYSQQRYSRIALELFEQIKYDTSIEANNITFIKVLDAISNDGALGKGRLIHAQIIRSNLYSDSVLKTSLISMYDGCGSLEDACLVFASLNECDLACSTVMILTYCHNGHATEALNLFHQLGEERFQSSEVISTLLLSFFSTLIVLQEGKLIHALIIATRFEFEAVVASALVTLYTRLGILESICEIFCRMPNKTTAAWNAIIGAYAQHGYGNKVLLLFRQMQLEGMQPNQVTFINLLFGCSHSGLLDEGAHHFLSITDDHLIPFMEDHYICLIDLLARTGLPNEAEDIIQIMPFRKDATTWMILVG